jgi:hypothetical protein
MQSLWATRHFFLFPFKYVKCSGLYINKCLVFFAIIFPTSFALHLPISPFPFPSSPPFIALLFSSLTSHHQHPVFNSPPSSSSSSSNKTSLVIYQARFQLVCLLLPARPPPPNYFVTTLCPMCLSRIALSISFFIGLW